MVKITYSNVWPIFCAKFDIFLTLILKVLALTNKLNSRLPTKPNKNKIFVAKLKNGWLVLTFRSNKDFSQLH